MNSNNLLMRIKAYIYENRHLILAGTLTSIAIISIIIILSFLKEDKNRTIASDGELQLFTTTYDNSDTDKNHITVPDESEENPDSQSPTISDIDFTLPEDANEEPQTTLSENSYKYLIKVNRILNCVTVYTKDSNGKYTVPYKAMACSTGKNIQNTPLGTFNTSSKYTWRLMVDGTHSQYATRVYGGILFHSVPCYSPKKNQLEYEEFNKLGSPASLGCIRLTVADAKWIYDNCPYGTTVIIYDDANSPGPLGKPSVIKIPADSPNKGWDPTDPDPANPWNICVPSITASDITANIGTNINLLSMVTAVDSCGNDISSSVSISGSYDINTPGSYPITLSVTDLLGRSASTTIHVIIVNNSPNSGTTQKTDNKPSNNPNTGNKPNNNPNTGNKPSDNPNSGSKPSDNPTSETNPTTAPVESDTNEPNTTNNSPTTEIKSIIDE